MTAEVVPLPRKKPTLDPMLALTAQGMNSVNAVILERMQSEIPLIPALAGHLISGGGKRLRPMLTLAGAELVGYNGTRHYKLAAAVEFEHLAVSYSSPSQGRLEFGWWGPLVQDGRRVVLRDYPRYRNPYADVPFPSDNVRFELGGHWLELDWEQARREASGFAGE